MDIFGTHPQSKRRYLPVRQSIPLFSLFACVFALLYLHIANVKNADRTLINDRSAWQAFQIMFCYVILFTAYELIEKNCSVVIGPRTSTATRAAQLPLAAAMIPQLAPVATNPLLTKNYHDFPSLLKVRLTYSNYISLDWFSANPHPVQSKNNATFIFSFALCLSSVCSATSLKRPTCSGRICEAVFQEG